MNKTVKAIIITAMSLSALSLASCGGSEESSSKSGTISLATTTTTTAAPESSEAETTTTTTAETTTAAETTTTAEETTTTTTTAAEPEVKEETLADKLKVTYNGTTFAVGDKFADIESKLGTTNDHFQSAHCTSEGMDDVYVYGGMDVAVFDGVITYISIYDNTFAGAPETACGLKNGSTGLKDILGEPTKTDGTQYRYDADGVFCYITTEGNAVNYIQVSALAEALIDF